MDINCIIKDDCKILLISFPSGIIIFYIHEHELRVGTTQHTKSILYIYKFMCMYYQIYIPYNIHVIIKWLVSTTYLHREFHIILSTNIIGG